jgi:hypothetical protein
MFRHQREQFFPICIIPHNGLTVVTALNKVMRIPGYRESWKSGHEPSLEKFHRF